MKHYHRNLIIIRDYIFYGILISPIFFTLIVAIIGILASTHIIK